MKIPKGVKTPSKDKIIRAVASSTAIETGQSIAVIETKLKSASKKYSKLTLSI